MFKNPFSFEGRIRRTEYGLSFIILYVYAFVIGIVIGLLELGEALMYLFLIPSYWFIWAQGAKRCHDRGNSGWFQLIPFYALWMLFQDGEPGPNQYGENPKDIQNNYHTANNQNNNSNNYNQSNNSGYPGNYGGGHNSSNLNQPSSRNQNSDSEDGYKNGSLYN